jgi:hypothetical protein
MVVSSHHRVIRASFSSYSHGSLSECFLGFPAAAAAAAAVQLQTTRESPACDLRSHEETCSRVTAQSIVIKTKVEKQRR